MIGTLALVGAAVAVAADVPHGGKQGPNIVLFVIDDLGFADLSLVCHSLTVTRSLCLHVAA
jgi:hypothetical protein